MAFNRGSNVLIIQESRYFEKHWLELHRLCKGPRAPLGFVGITKGLWEPPFGNFGDEDVGLQGNVDSQAAG